MEIRHLRENEFYELREILDMMFTENQTVHDGILTLIESGYSVFLLKIPFLKGFTALPTILKHCNSN